MRIAISGKGGTGKSTIARLLARKLGYKHYSMGDLQRDIAKEMGISIVELGEVEKMDSSFDRLIDERQKELAMQDNFVIDAWLSAYFIPDSIKIFMDADLDVRAKRVFERVNGEKYKSIRDAADALELREATNRARWIDFYGFDFEDEENYDFIIDTSNIPIPKVLKEILAFIEKAG